MILYLKEKSFELVLGYLRLFDQRLRQHCMLYFDPVTLTLSYEDASNVVLFFDFVEVVDDDTDKQVHQE